MHKELKKKCNTTFALHLVVLFLHHQLPHYRLLSTTPRFGQENWLKHNSHDSQSEAEIEMLAVQNCNPDLKPLMRPAKLSCGLQTALLNGLTPDRETSWPERKRLQIDVCSAVPRTQLGLLRLFSGSSLERQLRIQ
eukprot:s3725_g2.t1